MKQQTTRRSFLQTASIAALASVASNRSLAHTYNNAMMPGDAKSLVIVFQGDSITDGNRGRTTDPNHIMGHGYAFAVAARVGADFAAANHQFYNRGISGNTVTDLKNRWQKDVLDIHPDVLSILIGINDAAMLINKPATAEKDFEEFENTYREILQQAKDQNPNIVLVMGLPFVYPVAKIKDQWEVYRDTVLQLAIRIKKLAAAFDAVMVNYPAVFEKAMQKTPVNYWIWDGIHPTVPAHELMAREWIKQVSGRLSFLKTYRYR